MLELKFFLNLVNLALSYWKIFGFLWILLVAYNWIWQILLCHIGKFLDFFGFFLLPIMAHITFYFIIRWFGIYKFKISFRIWYWKIFWIWLSNFVKVNKWFISDLQTTTIYIMIGRHLIIIKLVFINFKFF